MLLQFFFFPVSEDTFFFFFSSETSFQTAYEWDSGRPHWQATLISNMQYEFEPCMADLIFDWELQSPTAECFS